MLWSEKAHLKDIRLDILTEDDFITFMRFKGKMGGQHKFPRVLKGKMLEDWISFRKGELLPQ